MSERFKWFLAALVLVIGIGALADHELREDELQAEVVRDCLRQGHSVEMCGRLGQSLTNRVLIFPGWGDDR